MTDVTLAELQASVQDKAAFGTLGDYFRLCNAFLTLLEKTQPTRIVSPSHHNYVFYQYDEAYRHRITRPLNLDLFIESVGNFRVAFERFIAFLGDLSLYQGSVIDRKGTRSYIKSNEVNK